MKAFFDGETMQSVNTRCINCGEFTPRPYCSVDCYLDGEGLELCDEGHEHAAGEDCSVCAHNDGDEPESRFGFVARPREPREA